MRFMLLVPIVILTSCTKQDSKEIAEFTISQIRSTVKVYEKQVGGALGEAIHEFKIGNTDGGNAFLSGRNAKKFDVKYDPASSTLLVYYCSGRILDYETYINLSEQSESKLVQIQPITSAAVPDKNGDFICENLY